MTPQQRIRLARRHAGLSQSALGRAVGVQRSAVSHWEASLGKSPSANHLREAALATGVQFEWLATGRGRMTLTEDIAMDSVAAADAMLIDDPLELRLLVAFREAPMLARAPLVEIAEQLASQRIGRRSGGDGGRNTR
ncbi:helix-turn-helix domain-containing protein [Lysobacter sp. D1-1-M9]|uniref:helix-turn-helix domain-containing protein n=1 Tax=Novilysobacter longmucuonensis TaxID=3098603 RepID=UPI002FCAB379